MLYKYKYIHIYIFTKNDSKLILSPNNCFNIYFYFYEKKFFKFKNSGKQKLRIQFFSYTVTLYYFLNEF